MRRKPTAVVRGLGLRAAIATPIVVEGRYWGVTVAATSREDFLAGTESRMADFVELVATAIANAQAELARHGGLRRLTLTGHVRRPAISGASYTSALIEVSQNRLGTRGHLPAIVTA